MATCPDPNRLRAWLDQELSTADSSSLESHLEDCSACQSSVEQILSGDSQDTGTGHATPSLSADRKWASSIADRVAHVLASPDDSTFSLADQIPDIDGYEVESLIAHGGMGIVYRATQTQAGRTVALKMMLSGYYAGPEAIARFQVEARAAAGLTHQYIVPVYDVGVSNGHHYFSMGYIDGSSGKELLQDGPIPIREAARLVMRVADAIAYAHGKGVIHRDLKPGNILIDAGGSPHVTDFGLARTEDAGDELTATGQILGTPSFMAPEQALGRTDEVGTAADIYALGALLYNCLTGRPPFQGQTSVDILRQVVDEAPIPPRQTNSEVDADLETICLKCLEKSARDRYGAAADVRDELSRYLDGRAIRARPLSGPVRLWRWCRRRPAIAGLTVGIALSLLAGTAVSTHFGLLATERAERAEQGTRVALTSLETILHTLQARLRDIPGARQIRRELLQVTLEKLEEILSAPSFQSQIDQDIANVHVDLAQLYQEFGGEISGGRADEKAEATYRLAVNMFDQIVLADGAPSVELLMEQSRALNQFGGFLSSLDRCEEAEPLLLRALMIRRSLLKDRPESPTVINYVARSLLSLADNYSYQGMHEDALSTILEGVELSRKLTESVPEDREHWRELHRHYCGAGDYNFDLRRNDEAIRFYRLSFDVASEVMRRFPVTANSYDDLSVSYERMGHYWDQVGDNRSAREQYEKMLAELLKAEELDQESRFIKDGLATAYDNLYRTYLKLGDTRAADLALRERDRIDDWLATPDAE